MTTVTLTRADVTPEMAALLRAGAADYLGLVCRPGQVQKNWSTLREAERLGFLRFIDIERPWITDAGRAAIGVPSEADADRARLREMFCKRQPLDPVKRKDPRTDFDYRSYRAMRWVCTLVIRQPDRRFSPRTLRVGRTSTSDPQFLGDRNSNIQPESEGPFILTLVPGWMTRPIVKLGVTSPSIFSTYPMALDETDPNFTDEERAIWDRLRNVCFSINSRIRNAGRRFQGRRRFGEFA